MFLLVVSVAALGLPDTSHKTANPVFAELLEPGVAVGLELRAKFPPPAMPDGLAADEQKAAIQRLLGSDHTYEEFTRRSTFAPQLLRIGDARPSDPAAPARVVDVYFIAYGDLDAAGDTTFLKRLTNLGSGHGGKFQSLNGDQLATRKIEPARGAETREGYGRVEFDILEKVRLTLTGRAMWSETPESLVAAAVVDPRFRGDPEFPNEWRQLSRKADGLRVGPAQPYGGAGLYLKVTRLVEPAGALFIEQHVVFAEPTGWFGGANLLRSKLPLLVRAACCGCRAGWPSKPSEPRDRQP
jgi:hypothetical protein